MATLEMEKTCPPSLIFQILHGRWAAETLRAGVELDVFSKIAEGAKTAAEVSAKIKSNERATELLLNGLSSLNLLEKKGSSYELNQLSRNYLVTSSPLYMGGFVRDQKVAEAWQKLPEVVQTGKPVATVNQNENAEEFFPKLAAGIFPLNFSTAHTVVSELKLDQLPAGSHALDLACGSGVWSIPLAQRNKQVKIDALDFPSVLEVTKEFATRERVADQYSYIQGSWRQCKLESDKYDVIFLGHILHSEGKEESDALLKECYRALRSGGKLVVAEMIGNDDFSGPPSAQLFAINMLILTDNGCIFGESELKDILKGHGYKNPRRLHLPFWENESPIMVADK